MKQLYWKCRILYSLYYVLVYPSMMMTSAHLLLAGYTPSEIAGFLVLQNLVLLLLRPLSGILIDKAKCHLLFTVLSVSMLAGVWAFFGWNGERMIRAGLYACLTAGASGVLMGAADGWVLKLSSEHPGMDYAGARAFGSISFAVTGLVYGRVLARFGLAAAPYVISILVLIIVATAWFIPEPGIRPAGAERERPKQRFWLFRSRTILMFAISVALGEAVLNFTDSYISVLFLERGGTAFHVGLFDFLRAVIEFAVMAEFVHIARRFDTGTILMAGLFGFFLKGFLFGSAGSIPAMMACCALQAVSFPLLEPGKMKFIKEHTDPSEIATALASVHLLASLLITLVITPAMGVLIARFGTGIAMMLNSFLALLGIVLFRLFCCGRRKQNAGSGS
ncbi:MAG: MFS transporter [Solobacterium sp.]|nr:MFS transporter [Solobacterium sp.]